MDSARWEGFEFRDGDIIISTPPKCGTTWTQQICALLVFGTSDLPAAVDQLSPWLDQTLRPLDDVVADLTAQTNRRFIKSHTPLDGLPWDDRVTYITVGRDPRDVALSWDNHLFNMNIPAIVELRGKAVGNDDLMEYVEGIQPPLPDVSSRFWAWVEASDDPMGGLDGTVHHLKTFWDVRDRPNVIMLHYSDLKADLAGQMRALAERLGLSFNPDVVNAATFDEMKKRSADVGPNQTENIWLEPERFFHKGTSGQWRDLIAADDPRYWNRVGELTDAEFSAWLHK